MPDPLSPQAGRLTFRTVFGGTTLKPDYYGEPKRITRDLADTVFAYDLDLFLHIGGEISAGDGVTGLKNPRVSLAKRSATGQLSLAAADAAQAEDPAAFLRHVVYDGAADLIKRIAKKDPTVDEAAELAKLSRLNTER